MGSASASVTGERCITMPPSMMSPDTSSVSPLPRSDPTNRARPMVPAAPGTLSTMGVLTMPVRCSTCCIARAVWSQPPPGAAGATIRSLPGSAASFATRR
jgi:hypothetical protein